MAESIRRSYREFVGVVADVLDGLGIEYGIAGSFASSQYGEPRQTLDVDLTLHLRPTDADRFAAAFEAVQMAADPYAIRETYDYTQPLPFAGINYATAGKQIAISGGKRPTIKRLLRGEWNGRIQKRSAVNYGCMRPRT